MFGLSRMVAWTMTAIAMLLLLASNNALSQDADSNEIDRAAAQKTADRYEQILSSRPQLGPAFDRFYEYYARQGTLPELCERLERAAQSGPAGNLYQLLGLIQLRRGLRAEAIASFTHAETMLPTDPLASLYRSRALALSQQYVSALAALKSAVDRKPNQTVALEIVKELRQLQDRGIDIDAAKALLHIMEQQFPTSPQVNEKLADCYVEFGIPAAALPVYDRLIELTPDPLRRIEIRMQRARLKKRVGAPEQSLSELQQLLGQVKPQSWLHTSLLEQVEQLTEELQGVDGLVAYYERTLQNQPDNVESMLRLARILRNRSRIDDAKIWISKAIEVAPTQPEPLLAMVDLMEETEQFIVASELMSQLVQLDSSNADHVVRWGRMEARSSSTVLPSKPQNENDVRVKRSNAAAIWKRLLIGYENDPGKALQVAELLREIELSEEAIKLYEQAVDVSGGKIEFSEVLAEYLIQLDRREQARVVLVNAMQLAGGDRETLIQISSVLKRFKFSGEALAALEKACQPSSEPTNRKSDSFSALAQLDDLIQLANLQSENERWEAALNTLKRAAGIAETSMDLTKVWDAQIKTYRQCPNLPELIAAHEKTSPSSEMNSFEWLQQLAIMQSASKQPADAASTALRATRINSETMAPWLLAARLQHEAGLSLIEIESLKMLCKLDVKNTSEYLQRTATIQFQLNQVDQALETAEKLFALPTATLQHYQTTASFCLQAKKPEQSLEILRRATRVFPRDRSAWMLLARQFAELKMIPASIEATWHILDLSREQPQQREAISFLVSLYKSNAADLIGDIKQFGVENEKQSEADLWSAWALLDIGSSTLSSEVIDRLVDRVDTKPETLRATVELALNGRDYLKAAVIQRRLLLVETTVDDQLKLGQILWLAGDLTAATREWSSVMRNRANDAEVTMFAKELADKSNWRMAVDFVNLGVELGGNSWNFIALGIFASIQEKNLTNAAELADQLLALNLPGDTVIKSKEAIDSDIPAVPLTAKDRLAWLEHAGAWQAALNVVDPNRAGYRTNQTNPRAAQAAAVRHLAMQRGASLRTNPLTRFDAHCFAEARALAFLAKFGKLNQQRLNAASEFAKYIESALATKNVEHLWDCILVMEPSSNQDILFTTSGSIEYRVANDPSRRYVEVLDALVDLNEAAAVELAINEIAARRQLQHQLADRLSQKVPPMEVNELERLQRLVQKVQGQNSAVYLTAHAILAVELIRSQRVAEGKQLLGGALAATKEISTLATCARQNLSRDSAAQQVIAQILLRAFQLELEASDESADLAFAIASYRSLARGVQSDVHQILFDMVRLQAKRVEGLTTDLFYSDSRSNESRRAYRNFRMPAAATPDRSSILSTSLRAALLDSSRDDLSKFAEIAASFQNVTPAERVVRCFAASAARAILNETDIAITLLQQAEKQAIATEIVRLYEVWLLAANQRFEEARTVIDRIDAPNEAIQREVELWKMDLAIKLGNKTESQRAAQALSKLPLSVHENADVAAVLRN